MKLCKVCNVEKDLSEFGNRSATKDKRAYYCKQCASDIYKTYYKFNKRYKSNVIKRATILRERYYQFVLSIKEHYKCSNCQEGDSACLDFHHVDQATKTYNIANITRFKSLEKLKAEIKKCCVICSNCHRKLHAGQNIKVELCDSSHIDKVFTTYKEDNKTILKTHVKKELFCKCGRPLGRHAVSCYNCYRKSKQPKIPKDVLHKLIWEKPLTHIAKDYGLSANCIKDWAIKYNINRPPKGYWLKK